MCRGIQPGIALRQRVDKYFMAALRRYDEELRAIGQSLEAKGVTGFELYNARAGYFIKDLREHTPSFHSTIRNWPPGHRNSDKQFVTYGLELADVWQLSQRGRARPP